MERRELHQRALTPMRSKQGNHKQANKRTRLSTPRTGFAAAGPRPPDRPHPFLAGHALNRRGVMGRFTRLQWLLVAFLGLGSLIAPLDARAANPAESFVQSSIDSSYMLLDDRTLDAALREQRFGDQLRSMVDTRRVALFTLGPYARETPKQDVEGFTSAFADFLTAVYRQALERYKNQSIRVTGSTARSDDDVVVNAVVGSNSGQSSSLHIAFRVRRSDTGGYVVTDLQAEGAWLALTQRADFISYLQRHGGNLMLLADELESRAERIRSSIDTKERIVR
jgi:phospholipid transport system substrate-binding protein